MICNIVKYDYKKIVFDRNKYVGSKEKLDINKIQKFIKDYKKFN